MNDNFLHELRREPAPAFARRLRLTLHESETAWGATWRAQAMARWAGACASLAAVAITFSFPTVRAGAAQFLDLFRVVSFAAVAIDASRFEQIDLGEIDIATMIGSDDAVVSEPGPPVSYADLGEAAAAAGYSLEQPAWLPVGWERTAVEVVGAHAMELTARTSLLDAVLEQLGIDDVSVPAGLDGARVGIRIPSVTRIVYQEAGSDAAVHLLQAPGPELSFPAGVEPAQLAEVLLRILGLERDEAYELAWTIDWRSTLLVPVPAAQATYESVNVSGSEGLLIVPRTRESVQALLLWGTEDRVFALAGPLGPPQLLEMALTIQ